MATKKTANGKKTAIEIGAGIAAAGAAAAVAGYYFYGSKNAKAHRKIAAKWATDMKKEVVKDVKKLKNIDPKAFSAVVDRVAKTYRSAKSVNAADLQRAAKELKANWEMVKRETKGAVRKGASGAKAVKKAVKKASKKRAK